MYFSTSSSSSSSLSLFLISLYLWAVISTISAVELVFENTDILKDDLVLYMKPVNLAPNSDFKCETKSTPWGEDEIVCSGEYDIALDERIDFKFSASDGFLIQLNGTQSTSMEFEAVFPCGNGTEVPLTPVTGTFTTAFAEYQSIEGTEILPTIVGNSSAELMEKYIANESFIEVGRCEGCGECSIFTRLSFDGPFDNVQFQSVSWGTALDASKIPGGNSSITYYIGTDNYMWIRNPGTLELIVKKDEQTSSNSSASNEDEQTSSTSSASNVMSCTSITMIMGLCSILSYYLN